MTSSIRKENFTLQSNTALLQPFLRETMTPLLQGAGFDEKLCGTLLVVFGEAITNCIRHSYENKPGLPIEVTFEEFTDQIIVRVRDYGKKVDLEVIKRKEKPQLPPEHGGGLGVYIMKSVMDDVTYNLDHAEGNELILTKKK